MLLSLINAFSPNLLITFAYLANMISKCIDNTYYYVERLQRAYSVFYQNNYYVYFENIMIPYVFDSIVFWASGSAAPELMYCADKKIFFPWLPTNKMNPDYDPEQDGVMDMNAQKCLPILSLELIDADAKVAYDLTDFLEGVRFIELDGFPVPSILHVVSAWTLSSGIVPDLKRFRVRYIDSDGNTKILAVTAYTASECADTADIESDASPSTDESTDSASPDTTETVVAETVAAVVEAIAEAPAEAADAESPAEITSESKKDD